MSEFIKQFGELLSTIENHMITASFALILLAISMVVNQIMGAIMASSVNTFDGTRFKNSVIKGVLICIGILAFCFVLDCIPLLLQRVEILGSDSITQKLLTIIQLLSMLVIALLKYAREVYNKFLVLFDVKEVEVTTVIEELNDHDTNEIVPYSYDGDTL